MPQTHSSEPVVGEDLTPQQLLVFKEQIAEVRAFLRNKYDMNEVRQANFLVNLLTVAVIDLYDDIQDPEEYIRRRVENVKTCIVRNFNNFYETEVSLD